MWESALPDLLHGKPAQHSPSDPLMLGYLDTQMLIIPCIDGPSSTHCLFLTSCAQLLS
jgi:hypothetical protein